MNTKNSATAREATVHVGCAGWQVRREHTLLFGGDGSHLSRYARRFPAVELNSSFSRAHRPATYKRWAASVPAAFRFSVKAPKEITHERQLAGANEPLEAFLGQVAGLGDKLGPILFQLPPRLEFDRRVAGRFLRALRLRFGGLAALEPRHANWFGADAEALLKEFRVARVAADPAIVPAAAEPGGWEGLAYWRLHGSPLVYASAYGPARLETLMKEIGDISRSPRWCIFDNTKFGAAVTDALALLELEERFRHDEGDTQLETNGRRETRGASAVHELQDPAWP